jgi:putative FmdB family regulatory protein
MPTYEYICTKCGHVMEAFQSMKDAPLKRCPACKKAALKRQVGGGAGLIFKGSGFYITDYKKPSAGKTDAGAAKPSAPSPSKPAAAAAAAK